MLIAVAAYVPCPLCGEIHELRIHALLVRKVRSAASGENTEVRILSIVCAAAKKAGTQYTKRILPPFVIPYCQISREGVLAYLRRVPDGALVYALGLKLLGARDRRTIRRHIRMGLESIGEAALALASLLSTVPAYGALPPQPLEQSRAASLDELAEQLQRAGWRAGVRQRSQVPSIVYVHLASVFARAAKPLAIPLSWVLRAAVFHDTS